MTLLDGKQQAQTFAAQHAAGARRPRAIISDLLGENLVEWNADI